MKLVMTSSSVLVFRRFHEIWFWFKSFEKCFLPIKNFYRKNDVTCDDVTCDDVTCDDVTCDDVTCDDVTCNDVTCISKTDLK